MLNSHYYWCFLFFIAKKKKRVSQEETRTMKNNEAYRVASENISRVCENHHR